MVGVRVRDLPAIPIPHQPHSMLGQQCRATGLDTDEARRSRSRITRPLRFRRRPPRPRRGGGALRPSTPAASLSHVNAPAD